MIKNDIRYMCLYWYFNIIQSHLYFMVEKAMQFTPVQCKNICDNFWGVKLRIPQNSENENFVQISKFKTELENFLKIEQLKTNNFIDYKFYQLSKFTKIFSNIIIMTVDTSVLKNTDTRDTDTQNAAHPVYGYE